jgi:hypothetical protein
MSNPVTIVGEGHRVCVTDLPQEPEARLVYPQWELAPAKHGVRAVYQRRRLLQEGPGPLNIGSALVGPRGLEPVLIRLAQQTDLGCIYRTVPPAELRDLDVDAGVASGGADIAVLRAIGTHSRLLVRYGRGVDVARLAVQHAHGYPDATITVAVPHIAEARRLARLFRDAGIPTDLISSKGTSCDGSRVVVVTFGELGRAAARLHCLDLLLVLDGVAALGKVARDVLTPAFSLIYSRTPRVIGFVPADRHLALADRIGLMEVFGPETMTVPVHGWVERQVEVVTVQFNGGAASYHRRAVKRKRCNLWHHRLRNRLVARIARALATGDRTALLAIIRGLDSFPDFPVHAGVVVVVEGHEHAAALAAELPGWSIDAPAAGSMVRGIATFDNLRSRPLHDVTIIVRADGGTGLPPLSPFALASPSWAVARPLFVIDVMDDNHPELRGAANGRARAYIEAGWRPIGCDATDFVLATLFPEGGRK